LAAGPQPVSCSPREGGPLFPPVPGLSLGVVKNFAFWGSLSRIYSCSSPPPETPSSFLPFFTTRLLCVSSSPLSGYGQLRSLLNLRRLLIFLFCPLSGPVRSYFPHSVMVLASLAQVSSRVLPVDSGDSQGFHTRSDIPLGWC